HEIVDQPAIVRNFTKWQGRAMAPGDVSPLLAEAFRQVSTADARPVVLELPPDVLRAPTQTDITKPLEVSQPTVDRTEMQRAADLITAASSPLIVVGGGALDAAPFVVQLAELLDCPVTYHRRGRGVIDGRHPLAIPYTIAHDLWPQTDLVIAIGTRLQMQLLDWGSDDKLRQVWINPDPAAAHRMGSPDATLPARAEDTLPMLLQLLERGIAPRSGAAGDLDRRRREEAARVSVLEPQLGYLSVIRAALGEDGILVTDLTQVAYVTRAAFDVYSPRSFVFPGYPGTLGYGYPTALGAKVANPDRTVIATVGDGGFLFTATEMATAVRHGIDTITVVFDDAAFGNVRLMQREVYDGRVHATDLASPDFVAMARSFGVNGFRADGGPESLARAIDEAKAAGGPSVIVVPQGTWPSPWPVLATGRVRGG
ncbi:MAG: thiamine pyrophosphate-dependent enzyme, partial [Acidimicrobiia bacterium]|nr:thiamine pyrophosphate-dependent enzyme [Acidimicrobiia bacterium]